jgi:hypothetical protein
MIENVRFEFGADPVGNETKILNNQINIRQHQTIQIPVVNDFDQNLRLGLRNKIMTGTEMPRAQFATVKRNIAHIAPCVLFRMHKTADFLFIVIEKPQIFAAVNHVISLFEIFRDQRFSRIALKIGWTFYCFTETFGARTQTPCKRRTGAVHVIIKSATRAAGFSLIRLTKDENIGIRHK